MNCFVINGYHFNPQLIRYAIAEIRTQDIKGQPERYPYWEIKIVFSEKHNVLVGEFSTQEAANEKIKQFMGWGVGYTSEKSK